MGFLKDGENEVNEVTEMLKGITMTEDITLSPKGQDEIKTMEVDITWNKTMEVYITWKDIGGKLMKRYEPGKGLSANCKELLSPYNHSLRWTPLVWDTNALWKITSTGIPL